MVPMIAVAVCLVLLIRYWSRRSFCAKRRAPKREIQLEDDGKGD